MKCPDCKGTGKCLRCFGDGEIDEEFEFDMEMMKISEEADCQLPLNMGGSL